MCSILSCDRPGSYMIPIPMNFPLGSSIAIHRGLSDLRVKCAATQLALRKPSCKTTFLSLMKPEQGGGFPSCARMENRPPLIIIEEQSIFFGISVRFVTRNSSTLPGTLCAPHSMSYSCHASPICDLRGGAVFLHRFSSPSYFVSWPRVVVWYCCVHTTPNFVHVLDLVRTIPPVS